MICLDTTALIDLFNDDQSIRNVLNVITEPLVTTIVNYQEVMFGIDAEKENFAQEEPYYDEIFNQFIIYDLTKEACKKSSIVFYQLKRKGVSIEPFDAMIAGICLEQGVTKILTKNKKHFEKIKGIEIVEY